VVTEEVGRGFEEDVGPDRVEDFERHIWGSADFAIR
jgi:hypothetical protein